MKIPSAKNDLENFKTSKESQTDPVEFTDTTKVDISILQTLHLELKKININLTVQKNNIKKQNKAIQKKLDNMVNQNQDYEK